MAKRRGKRPVPPIIYEVPRALISPVLSGEKRQALVSADKIAPPGAKLLLTYRSQGGVRLAIADALCLDARAFEIDWRHASAGAPGALELSFRDTKGWRVFANAEGFADYDAMMQFYRKRHPQDRPWRGVLVRWDRARGRC